MVVRNLKRLVLLFGIALAVLAVAQTAAPRPIGVVTKIDAATKQIMIKTDAGLEMTLLIVDTTKFKRVAAGVTDIASAPDMPFTDVKVGDRVQASGKVAEDGKTVPARTVLVMTKDDVAKKQQSDQAEWQRRGVIGTVTAVDAFAKNVAISARNADGTNKPVTVTTTAKTQMLRYAPDSVRFADAKAGPLTEIQAGDQLRALGTRSEDGNSYAADEIISGGFRSLAATVVSVDEAAGVLKMTDLDSKKPVTVKINADSSLRRMPLQTAQFMASRYISQADGTSGRGGAPGGAPGGRGGVPGGAPGGGGPGGGGPGGGGPGRGGRGGDPNQMMDRWPALKLSELKPGDALIVSASKGSDASSLLAITMIAGVEPILSATPASQRPMILGNWSVDAGGGGNP